MFTLEFEHISFQPKQEVSALHPSTQTLPSQMAVRLSGKVASSSKQSESEEQPHR